MFSYQIFMVCSPTPSLEYLLERARRASSEKIQNELHSTTRSA
jgi:lipocalin